MKLDKAYILDHIHKIREIIRVGKLDDALDLLSDLSVQIYSSPLKDTFEEINLRNQIIDIESKWTKLREDVIKEIIHYDQEKVRTSQIQNNVLEYLDVIEAKCTKPLEYINTPKGSDKLSTNKYLIPIILLVGILGFFCVNFYYNKTNQDKKDRTTGKDSSSSVKDDCIQIDITKLEVKKYKSEYNLKLNSKDYITFQKITDANQAKQIIKKFQLTRKCKITSSQNSLHYFTTQINKFPSKSFPAEDCVKFQNPENLRIKEVNNRSYIFSADNLLLSASNQTEAKQTIKFLKDNKINSICYIGERTAPSMTYFKS